MLPRYSGLAASSRYRFFAYVPYLRAARFDPIMRPFFDDTYLVRLYGGKHASLPKLAASYWRRARDLIQRDRASLVWLYLEAFPWVPVRLERMLLRADLAPLILAGNGSGFPGKR